MHTLQEAVPIANETPLSPAEKGALVHADTATIEQHGAYTAHENAATDEESTLRRVAGHISITAYVLCIVEFAERGVVVYWRGKTGRTNPAA